MKKEPFAPTPLMAKVLDVIRAHTDAQGVPPTYRTILREAGIGSSGQLHSLLTRMRARGLVDWQAGRARSLKVLAPRRTADPWSDLARLPTTDLRMLRTRIDVLIEERAAQ
jgi:SOS-response transcriptional repressor LexA